MRRKSKLLFLAAFLAIAFPFLLLTGESRAGYMSDGAVQNGATGEWITPNDMVCVVGVHPDGTLDIADGVTNSRQCIYLNKGTMNGGTPFDLTSMTTSDQCTKATGTGGNDGAKHSFATSICVDGNGYGIPLTDLDRTMSMCVAKGGIWKQTSSTPPYPGAPGTYPTPGFAGACVAYGRQFKGQDASGTPLTFGAKGTSTADAGFCYAAINVTTRYSTSTTCPVDANGKPNSGFNSATAFDYSWSSSKCAYAKGIKGYLNAALTKADGTTYAAGSYQDLSAFTTMGECLANGGSWANWIGKPPSSASVVTTPLASTVPAWDFSRQAPDADEGCLHCHSTVTQYNGPAERWKDSYLKTGHKNMLRKVTPGKIWAGPNEQGDIEPYTDAATGPLDFTNAKAMINGVWQDLLYLFGDWMAPAPSGLDVVVNMAGYGKYNGSSNYSCAACHTTGWNNASAGLCSLSSKTTSTDCSNAGGTWYPLIGVQGIGIPGFSGAQPTDSFPTVVFSGAGKWNIEGITCGRCHNATSPKVFDTQIAASQFPSTHPTNGGMGALASGVGTTNLCFGCHQSIAKTNKGVGADADLNHPEYIPVKNAATAPDYVPEFNGHVLGNQFLNSPHARYTGSIVPNALGKYDLQDTTGNDNGNVTKYNSRFQGSTCFQSATSNSPAKTMIVNGVIEEIKTKTDCETLYGAGAWRSDQQGTCSTCHDVHNSMFVAETREASHRKVCTDCHTNSVQRMWHPTGQGTPFDVSETWEACVTCHMPRATSGGFPMHLWRINTDVNYSTFPSAAEFGIGATATSKIANMSPDGTYTNAVWVDVDYVCGQCHGGSRGPGATRNGAEYFTKEGLADAAALVHRPGPIAQVTTDVSGYTVTLKDTSIDDSIVFPANAVTIQWGDKSSTTGAAGSVFTHTYGKAKKFQIVYTIVDHDGYPTTKKINVVIKKTVTASKK
jgi:predicted CXXCH cytochrome family protein